MSFKTSHSSISMICEFKTINLEIVLPSYVIKKVNCLLCHQMSDESSLKNFFGIHDININIIDKNILLYNFQIYV